MANLTQSGLSLTAGQTYTLSFDADITAGILSVYQGTQLIYDSTTVQSSFSELVRISENIVFYFRNPISRFESILVSENVSIIRV
jgi:hypothetical protein